MEKQENTNIKMKTLARLHRLMLLLLAALFLAYYGICVYYAWAGVSWLWLWPLLAGFCLLRWGMLRLGIRGPKPLRIAYTLCLTAGLMVFAYGEGRIVSAMFTQPEPGLDYVITLGARVSDSKPTSPLLLRIQRTAAYLEENPDTLVIASGGQGSNEDISEAACIAEYLVSYGVDPSRILLEDRARDTEENIRYSFAMIPEGASCGVVTNSFHLYRAMRVAELQGHAVSGIPARTLLPLGIHYTVREFFAVVELELKALLG